MAAPISAAVRPGGFFGSTFQEGPLHRFVLARIDTDDMPQGLITFCISIFRDFVTTMSDSLLLRERCMQGFRESLGVRTKTHMVARERDRLGSKLVGKRHPHAFDGLAGGLLTDSHQIRGLPARNTSTSGR